MNVLSVHNLAKIGREKPLFTEVTFGLNEGEKAALIGKNGCGKSTLLSIIAGKLHSEEGEVVMNKTLAEGRTVSYLPQNPEFDPESTILEYIFSISSFIFLFYQLIRTYIPFHHDTTHK